MAKVRSRLEWEQAGALALRDRILPLARGQINWLDNDEELERSTQDEKAIKKMENALRICKPLRPNLSFIQPDMKRVMEFVLEAIQNKYGMTTPEQLDSWTTTMA